MYKCGRDRIYTDEMMIEVAECKQEIKKFIEENNLSKETLIEIIMRYAADDFHDIKSGIGSIGGTHTVLSHIQHFKHDLIESEDDVDKYYELLEKEVSLNQNNEVMPLKGTLEFDEHEERLNQLQKQKNQEPVEEHKKYKAFSGEDVFLEDVSIEYDEENKPVRAAYTYKNAVTLHFDYDPERKGFYSVNDDRLTFEYEHEYNKIYNDKRKRFNKEFDNVFNEGIFLRNVDKERPHGYSVKQLGWDAQDEILKVLEKFKKKALKDFLKKDVHEFFDLD